MQHDRQIPPRGAVSDTDPADLPPDVSPCPSVGGVDELGPNAAGDIVDCAPPLIAPQVRRLRVYVLLSPGPKLKEDAG
jgi:hypothetical protein